MSWRDPLGAVMSVTVDAQSVRCGDQILIGGMAHTVRDMTALPWRGRRLLFEDGTSYTMLATTVLYATRRVDPRRAAPGRGSRRP